MVKPGRNNKYSSEFVFFTCYWRLTEATLLWLRSPRSGLTPSLAFPGTAKLWASRDPQIKAKRGLEERMAKKTQTTKYLVLLQTNLFMGSRREHAVAQEARSGLVWGERVIF